VLRDLDRLQHATIENAGKRWLVRTEAKGCVPLLMQVAGIALPPRIQALPPSSGLEKPSPTKAPPRPRRSATHP
jgi:hypothetical protein